MANTDIQPATTLIGLVRYIAKYVSKPEKASMAYKEMESQVLKYTSDKSPLLSFTSKMLNKLVGERDYSAQEVSHILLQLPMSKGSREVRVVDCRPEDKQDETVVFDGDGLKPQRNALQKYRDRVADVARKPHLKDPDPNLANVTFLDWLQFYDWDKFRRFPKARPRVISYWPRYDPKEDEGLDGYSRVKMMLHHPFKEVEDLLTVDGQVFDSLVEAYVYCSEQHRHTNDYYDPVRDEDVDSDSDDDSEADYNGATPEISQGEAGLEADLLYSRLRPGGDDLTCPASLDLGNRTLDRLYDWMCHVDKYKFSTTYWEEIKAQFPADESINPAGLPLLGDLNAEQRAVYDVLVGHYHSILRGESLPPLEINLDGKAGTGKTSVILMASLEMIRIAEEAGEKDPVLRSAPTGVAAHLFLGRTLHSLLMLPIKGRNEDDVSPAHLTTLQAVFRFCKYLIIDEKSMVGLKQMGWIDKRLRQIFPAQADKPFGGISVVLCGDFHQLPPVGEKTLFSRYSPGDIAMTLNGRAAYRALGTTMRLTQVMRQAGEDIETSTFRIVLDELRANEVTKAGWLSLSKRVRNQLPPQEIATFDNAMRLYFRNEEVRQYNHDKLRDTGAPVKKILARHTGRHATAADSDAADNLDAELLLAIGCMVMLTSNLWVENGLVNGSLGTVHNRYRLEGWR
jgi:hypothetical protein